MKQKQPKKQGRRILFRTVMAIIMVLCLGLLTVGNYVALAVYPVSINNLFTVTESGQQEDATTKEDWIALCQTIEAEGAVLLRNENNTLPLKASASEPLKINLLGHRAYDPIYGGTGSGAGDTSSAWTLVSALEANGFTVNPALEASKIYADRETNQGDTIGWFGSSLELKDRPISEYTGDISFENLKAYSDIAIVVFGRSGGEGSDLTDFAETEGRHYLQLSTNEEDLIRTATETFDKVIVLYNGANTLELGFLEEYNVDAALWIGDPGVNGFPSVAKLLNGTITPSGRLVDTYAYDAKSAPSFQNYGATEFTNSPDYVDSGWTGQVTNHAKFVDYVEGIYVGYRWYETAAVEGYLDYDSTVQYPFGYGLSYTTFKQEIVGCTANGSALQPGADITLEVKVTNTGKAAGKEVVQVYYTAPYTDYDKTNGVEKAAVNLVRYAKTGLLQPGESETVQITFPVEEMASYDESHVSASGTAGAYMLDAGSYTVSVRENAHTAIQSITLNLSAQHFYDGTSGRASDEQTATNHLQDSRRGIYLSRKDGFANYEEAMASVTAVASDEILAELNREGVYDTATYDDVITATYTAGKDYRTGSYTASSADLKLADLAGAAYDDPRWDTLLNQMNLEDLQTLIGNGGWSTAAIESIGKAATVDIDGPAGMNSLFDANLKGVQYPANVVLAATWNAELALDFGKAVADEAHEFGVSGWYAPAMNIHRSPFSGRNFEYSSEDGYLSGVVAAQTTKGARMNELYAYIKHFALNDQETERSGRLTTWASEQAIREIYLKPFEIAVKEGEAIALMTSMNHIGATWAGNKAALLTDILRNEWGFVGMTITDSCIASFMTNPGNVDTGIRVGQDLWLGMGGISVTLSSNADIYYARRAAKNILYTQANSRLIPSTVLPWRTWLYILDGVLVCVLVLCAVLLVRDIRKGKQAKAAQPVEAQAAAEQPAEQLE